MNIPSARFGVQITRFMKTYEADLIRQIRQLADEATAPVPPPASSPTAPTPPAASSSTAPTPFATNATMPAAIDLPALITRHRDVLIWMRHERLVHLIVTCLSAIFLMFVAGLDFVFKGHLALLALLVIALVLTLAYLVHYFRLENTVQRWHVYYLELLDHQRQQSRPDATATNPDDF